MSNADLTAAALAMSEDERAELVLALIDSLGGLGRPVDPFEWEQTWTREIMARSAAIREGESTVFADTALDELEVELVARRRRAS